MLHLPPFALSHTLIYKQLLNNRVWKWKLSKISALTTRHCVEKAISYLQAGKGILLVDDENRENEGDIIYSAEKMTVKDMALMIRECSGIVCLCLTPEKCNSLGLHQMVEDNTSKNQTAFTISIEAKEGVTTGVSAPTVYKQSKQPSPPMPNRKTCLTRDMFSLYEPERMEF